MHPALQITLAILATIAAIASAIAAWTSQISAREALNFQKKLSKNQDSLFLIRSTIELLWQLRRILANPLEVSDEEFTGLENTHRQIKANLESLTRSGALPARESKLFDAISLGEVVDRMPSAGHEIELEINRLQTKINEIFS